MVGLPFVLDFPGWIRAHFHPSDGIRERLVAFGFPVLGVVAGSMVPMVAVPIGEVG
jgi:hypothetical protein